ncbi:GntR family transcriptional regulator [Microlunatus phosphovorus]|nr:GntR family transcriptional regulator [Microlunatus phosphovorus]
MSLAATSTGSDDRPRSAAAGIDALRPFDGRATAAAAATKRVLLGRLHTEDAASAVARRLRTAIGLGVLANGEKLPREIDLARQLGVTAFSLREALGTLRAEGLIVTRVGKNGGSYVAHTPVGDAVVGEELLRWSATELRDLGDWRAALTTYAAWLAARRDPVVTADRLLACAAELAAATGAAEGRRAMGRFHVELSAGAQSMRLTRAELVAHEEFDWLVQVLLRGPVHRRVIAGKMRMVADAVRSGDPAQSWAAGQMMVSCVVTELLRTRLQLIALQYAKTRDDDLLGDGDPAAEIRTVFERVVGQLDEMGRDVAAAFDQPLGRQPLSAQLLGAEVARSVLPRMSQLDDLVYGLGFMAEVGVVPDAQYWLEWWQRAADGTFDRDFRHELDPSRDDFYEYGSKGYMARPRETGEPTAMGPYIDHGGVDDYLVTVSMPVQHDGSFVGIMAADIRVADLERVLSPWLARANGIGVVLNAERRVLVSNSVRFEVGDVVPPEADPGLTEVGCFGWLIGRTADAP